MRGIIGLELVAIGKKESFEIFYEGGNYYRRGTKTPIEGLIDNACFSCGTSFYTLEEQEIEFCPNCGK
ncbi:MAG: hypothetical protein FJ088_12715, partial [Deltaproteobacteria bacterium]|nr:hypothetical protein [Deltaproteobacteria bacterium]